MTTRIEKARSRLCVFLLGIAFFVIFVVLLGIGDAAPGVLLVSDSKEDAASSMVYVRDEQINTYRVKFELTRENQLFWMDFRLSTGDTMLEGIAPVTMDLDLTVSVYTALVQKVGSHKISAAQFCAEDAEWCTYTFLFTRDFVDHDEYIVEIDFPDPEEYLLADGVSPDHAEPLFDADTLVTSINPDFTRFEIGWKYFWFCQTLLIMFCPCGLGFMSALRRQRKDNGQKRTYHQKWTAQLLWGLLWFDDPFIALTVYTNWAKFFSAVFILSASIFVFLILLFWLCFLSDLRFMQSGDGNGRRGICYWIPKLVLTLCIGATVFGGYIYYRFENTLSFDYTGVDDQKKAAEALAGLLGFLLAAYMLWAIFLILRSCGGLRRLSPSFVLLYFVTLLSCLVAVIGVFVAAYYPYSTSGLAFIGIHGLLNLYVWTLAVSFAPVRESASRGAPSNSPAMPTTVTGTDKDDVEDMNGWADSTDNDFKAVEL